ncbi:MAG: DUF2760 domain-containing protein [Bryobacterales bacterium]|nr:DUF2760 domain-containing protein [Bryobacterales bacterium]
MWLRRILLGLRCLASIFKSGTLNVELRQELGVVRVEPEIPSDEEHGAVAASDERIRGAVQILRALQAESGLVDFLQEDLRYYSDQQLAHGVRAMQPDARHALQKSVRLVPIVDKAEGELQDLPEDPAARFANGSLQIDGNAAEFEAIHGGVLRHRGWRVAEAYLLTPPLSLDSTVVHPAVYEVE